MRKLALALAVVFAVPMFAQVAFAKTPLQIKQENKAKDAKAKTAAKKAAKKSGKK